MIKLKTELIRQCNWNYGKTLIMNKKAHFRGRVIV